MGKDYITEAYTKWWNSRKDKYPYHAETNTKIRPDDINPEDYTHNVSAVLKKGVRIWGFLTEEARDRFVEDYKGTVVE